MRLKKNHNYAEGINDIFHEIRKPIPVENFGFFRVNLRDNLARRYEVTVSFCNVTVKSRWKNTKLDGL